MKAVNENPMSGLFGENIAKEMDELKNVLKPKYPVVYKSGILSKEHSDKIKKLMYLQATSGNVN